MAGAKLQTIYGNLIRLFWGLVISVGVLILLGAGVFLGFDYIYAGRVLPGVHFLDVDLGGMTHGEVLEAVDARVDTTDVSPLQLEFDGLVWEMNPSKFGFEININQLAKQALAVGRRSNLLDKIIERGASVLGFAQPIVSKVDLVETFNKDTLAKYLRLIYDEIAQPSQNAVFVRNGDRVTEFIAPQNGQELDIKKTILLITHNVLNPNRRIILPVTITKPRITLAQANDLGITTLMARGVSDFSGSPPNRRHNIAVGAARFDGVLIPPGKKFSFLKTLGNVNASTGYLPELVIKGDETIPEYGGGLCQVSTTAFRAILNSGLPVNARRNHSYRVVYYEPAGTDATIYQPYPDLQFTNDTEAYIMMDTYIKGNQLFFDFYGAETGRKVKLDGPYIFNVTTYPEPIYIDTSTIPVGEIQQVDSAHRGADAVLYRKIYDKDGKLISKDTFNSHYIPWPAKYLRGVEEAPPVEADLENVLPDEAASEEAKVDPINTGNE
ncbi:hypothetical protein DRH29_00945 [candidate division Kazan bacterium]|uniref:YoaR-like putative peptidoglycan binding domain-containing protein n=1 Tax=candidate division Kazan bacterium TaxID=2202143 RepID=A0A420ZD58_UNCK3|nr:MAG: hypothetical protein DRH29_00945 [candidate division Kazan bacterium]